MTDKGYDSQANRDAARARGITPVIPRRENSKQRGRFFPKRFYKLRARIEQTIGKLKRFKRVAMRCEKTDISYLSKTEQSGTRSRSKAAPHHAPNRHLITRQSGTSSRSDPAASPRSWSALSDQ
jgi:transposase